MLNDIYGISQKWSAANPVILVRSWRKFLSDLEEDDLHVFCNEEISKSEILDVVCFENIDEETLKNGYRVMRVKWASST
jgi:hypothetical protein